MTQREHAVIVGPVVNLPQRPADALRQLNADAALARLSKQGRDPVAFWTPRHGATVEAWVLNEYGGVLYRKSWRGGSIAEAAEMALRAEGQDTNE